jgi:DNA-binding LacI/PurR family transcriptional regulator
MGSPKITKFVPGIRSTAELAKKLNLSRWTISRFLNGHPGVHPVTASRIQAAIEELGFTPNPLAQGLKTGRTKIIGICLPEIEGPYLAQKLDFLRKALSKEGYQVMAGMTHGDLREEVTILNRFRVLRAAGVILVASRFTPENLSLRRFQETRIPLILLDPLAYPLQDSIRVDRSVGMKEAVKHLLRLGHRHITALGIGNSDLNGASRRKGMEETLVEEGLDPATFLHHIPLPSPSSTYYEMGRLSAPLVWNKDQRNHSTAVLAWNDRVAIGLMDGLRAMDVRVPEDLSLIGYDNMEVSAFTSPALTTIDAQPDELVRTATEHLLAHIRQEPLDPMLPDLIATRLIIRGSTAAAPSRA